MMPVYASTAHHAREGAPSVLALLALLPLPAFAVMMRV